MRYWLIVWVFLVLSSPAFGFVQSKGTVQELQNIRDADQVKDLFEQVQRQWESVKASRRRVDAKHIELVWSELKAGIPSGASPQQLKQISSRLLDLQILMMPSRPIEMRGALLDADLLDADPAEIKKWLDRLQRAGFNAVFPELFRRGYALFPNRVVAQDIRYARKQVDALKEICRLAQERGLAVYPWIWTYRVFSPSLSTANPMAERLPALLSPQLKPVTASDGLEDESASFISPASPEWRQLLSVLLTDVARQYPIEGFLLDYIRYGNGAVADQLSFTRFQMEQFQQRGAFPPAQWEASSDLEGEWLKWRENQVHQMLAQLRQALNSQHSDLQLGAAVFRNQVNARISKMQDWRTWRDRQWIQFVAPMLYARNLEQLDLWLDWESDFGRRQELLYPILGLHTLNTPGALFQQLSLLQQRKVPGVLLFGLRQLNDEALARLKMGPFREKALIPKGRAQDWAQHQLQATASWLRELNTPSTSSLASLWQEASANPEHSQLSTLVSTSQSAGLSPELAAELKSQTQDAQRWLTLLRQGEEAGQPSRHPGHPLAEAMPLPRVQIPFVEAQPVLDGDFSEPFWQRAQTISDFWWSQGSSKPQVETRLQLAHDGQFLYLGFHLQEPRMDRLQAKIAESNEQLLIQQDDTVEVFLSSTAKDYHYLVLNPRNTRFAKTLGTLAPLAWDSATQQWESAWLAELRIPLSALGTQYKPLYGNFCRRRPQEISPYHCWSFTFGGVHRPDRFGMIELLPPPQP